MSVTLNWFLPTNGDGRSVVDRPHSNDRAVTTPREPSLDYLAQVARAAEANGFHAVLTPTGSWCEDAWIATAALIGATSKLKFLVAFRPGTITPTLAAQMAVTYQKISGGRLMFNIVTGGESAEQQRFGVVCAVGVGQPVQLGGAVGAHRVQRDGVSFPAVVAGVGQPERAVVREREVFDVVRVDPAGDDVAHRAGAVQHVHLEGAAAVGDGVPGW